MHSLARFALPPSFASSPSRLPLPPTFPTTYTTISPSLRSGSRPRVPAKWAAPLARGTQLKVSHTGGHAALRRAATTTTESIPRLLRLDSSLVVSAVLPSLIGIDSRSSIVPDYLSRFVLTNRQFRGSVLS